MREGGREDERLGGYENVMMFETIVLNSCSGVSEVHGVTQTRDSKDARHFPIVFNAGVCSPKQRKLKKMARQQGRVHQK